MANLLALVVVLAGCVACGPPRSYWAIVIAPSGTLTVQGLCGATIPEVATARATDSFLVEESDYFWRASPRTADDVQNSVVLFAVNPHYVTTPAAHPEGIPYPFLVVVPGSVVEVPSATMSPGIMWNHKFYDLDQLPQIEDEYNRVVFSGRLSC